MNEHHVGQQPTGSEPEPVPHGVYVSAVQGRQAMREGLKEAREAQRTHLQQLRGVLATQGRCDLSDPYMRGLYNGIELAVATLENRGPVYLRAGGV